MSQTRLDAGKGIATSAGDGMQQQQKIFGIGLLRTGTTSLDLALKILGYRSIHYPPLNRLREVLNYYDAAVDTPVACSFRELDMLYPGSHFILTIRDFRSWLASTQQFFHGPAPVEPWRREVRLKAYGVLQWNRSAFLNAYHRHIETVLDHFGDRPDQLLILDITAGEGWETLCPFLGTAVPAGAFPHGAGGRPVPNSSPAT